MADIQDPFEAFRKKKQAEREQQKAQQEVSKLPPREDGRPRGFASHRMDFDQADAPAPQAPPPPKGYDPGRIKKLPPPPPTSKPKGFARHNIGPGPKQPLEPEEEPPRRRAEE